MWAETDLPDMPKSLINIVLLLILLSGLSPAFAQEAPSVKAAIDKNQILIGEPIRFSIDVLSPMVSGNQLPQFDSIPYFEMIEKASRDSVISPNGTSYHLEWKLTSFDSGTRMIPSFAVTINNQIYRTDSLAVEVSFGKMDSTNDYHDIKSIIDLENPDVKYIYGILIAVTLIALFLFIWFIRYPFVVKKYTADEMPVSAKTALDDAMTSLDQLKKMLRDDPTSVKKYYSGLNDTLRIFLQRRLGLVTMEKTSEELILSLSSQEIPRENFSKLTGVLRMGDFVKFAKYIPGPFENETNLELMRSSIELINETGK